MTIIEERTAAWLDQPGPHGSTDDETSAAEQPISRVKEKVNEILGYDIFASQTLAQGYAEYAAESLTIAEDAIAAADEALPDE